MSKEKKNIRLYLFLLSVVIGAFLAAMFIRYNLQTHKGKLVIGDGLHSVINQTSDGQASSEDNQAEIGDSVNNLGTNINHENHLP